jgi:hypothetical protein
VSASDLAIVAALVFAWDTLSARLERFDVTAPIIFVAAGLVLTHGPLAVLGVAPAPEAVKVLGGGHACLVLFSDASRVGLRDLRGDLGLCLRLLGVGLPLTIGLGRCWCWRCSGHEHLAGSAGGRGPGTDGCGARRGRDAQSRGSGQDHPTDQRGERAQRRDRHPVRARRAGGCVDCGA